MEQKLKTSQIVEKVGKINGYLKSVSNKAVVSKKIHPSTISFELYHLHTDVIYYNKQPYFSVYLRMHTPLGPIDSSDYVYILDGGRPNVRWITSKFNEIIKAPFPGTFEIVSGRYLFQMQRTHHMVVSHWLRELKYGKSELDPSWLAPLQELTFHKDQKNKFKIKNHNSGWEAAKISIHDDEPSFPSGLPRWHPASPEQLSKKAVNSATPSRIAQAKEIVSKMRNDVAKAKAEAIVRDMEYKIYFQGGAAFVDMGAQSTPPPDDDMGSSAAWHHDIP